MKDVISLEKLLGLLKHFKERRRLKDQLKRVNQLSPRFFGLESIRITTAVSNRMILNGHWTAFSYHNNKCEVKNFHEKYTKIQNTFNLWSQRGLSLYDKIT